MKNALLSITLITFLFGAVSCSNDDNKVEPAPQASTQEVIDSYVQKLVIPNLKDLNVEATELNAAINTFLTNKTAENLEKAQKEWYETRAAWEQSEAMLFGPVVDNNFDPRIDSWPVDFNAIQDAWNSDDEFTQDYINGLNDELKGFHPIEFLLFGQNSGATKDDFTDERKTEYLKAMSLNLKRITDSLYGDWNPAAGNFGKNLLELGTDNSKYDSKHAVMIEIANAMAGIVSEVGEGKLATPFSPNDPSKANPLLAESPFSQNSFTDFTNNLIGAQNVYLGGYGDKTGIGISAFVSQYNKNLDAQIKAKFKSVIDNLKNYQVSFGTAITENRSQVQKSIDALEDLNTILETDLINLINQHVKN